MNSIVFIVASILLILLFIKGSTSKPLKKIFRGKPLKVFFGVYILSLLVGCVLFPFIPLEKYELANETLKNQYLQPDEFYNAITYGKIDEIKNLKMSDKFTLEYNKDSIHLSTNTDEFIETSIIIARKDTNDQLIEATNYYIPINIDDMILAQKLPSTGVVLSENALTFHAPQQVDISIAKLKKEFIISQFTGELQEFAGESYVNGQSILFIQIPKDLKIISSPDNMNITYVGE